MVSSALTHPTPTQVQAGKVSLELPLDRTQGNNHQANAAKNNHLQLHEHVVQRWHHGASEAPTDHTRTPSSLKWKQTFLAVVWVSFPYQGNKPGPCVWLVPDSQLRGQRVEAERHQPANSYWGTPQTRAKGRADDGIVLKGAHQSTFFAGRSIKKLHIDVCEDILLLAVYAHL